MGPELRLTRRTILVNLHTQIINVPSLKKKSSNRNTEDEAKVKDL